MRGQELCVLLNPQSLLYSLVALLPLATVCILLIVARRPAGQVMPIAYLVTVGIALLVWRVPATQVAAASVQGFVAALEILYIVFGAILLLNTLRTSGAIATFLKRLCAACLSLESIWSALISVAVTLAAQTSAVAI